MLAVCGVGSAASADGWGVVRPSSSDEPQEELEQKQQPIVPVPSPQTMAAPQRTATRQPTSPPKTPPPFASATRPAEAMASSSAIGGHAVRGQRRSPRRPRPETEPTATGARTPQFDNQPTAPPDATAPQTPPRAAGPRCTCSRASWIYGGETGLSCDGPGCGCGFKSGEARYSCETCDFDLCAGCAEKMGVGVNSASKKRRR